VTDPRKRYHLELVTTHLQVGSEVEALMHDMGYVAKRVLRNSSTVTYFKQSEPIEDLLTLLGAPAASTEIMAAKIEKEMRNTVNRRVNCDAANVEKAVQASRE
jgi:DNA-binding protein WhiA